MKLIKRIIGSIVLIFSLYLFFYFMYSDKYFILVYHRIDDFKGGLRSLYVKPETFEKQIKYLTKKGYKAITLDELKYIIDSNKKVKKIYCITFDDGYKDISNAYKILKRYNLKATVYLHINALIDGKYTYPKMSQADMISFDEMKNMIDIFEIGSHTFVHPDLSRLEEKEIKEELKKSKEFLEKKFGVEIKHFCYPFGKVFNNYRNLLYKEGYYTATTLNSGLVDPNKSIDWYLLPRVEWKEFSSMSFKDFLRNLDFYIKILLGI
ncbi:MAG: polysaccharide deacetylase family protein [Endomicrobia bacterium]|nr:polysaccharide deacetylase family protein [Endomicrobiia bacterium]